MHKKIQDPEQALRSSLAFWLTKKEIAYSKIIKYDFDREFLDQKFRLKKMYRCRLSQNAFYYGYKIHKIRARILTNFLKKKIKIAFSKRESERLSKTKIPFYKEKIAALEKAIDIIVMTKLIRKFQAANLIVNDDGVSIVGGLSLSNDNSRVYNKGFSIVKINKFKYVVSTTFEKLIDGTSYKTITDAANAVLELYK